MASEHDRNPAAGQRPSGLHGAPSLDRRRIDSDVRELLRQPSTPWITFNRASRASNLAVGDLLPRRASIVDAGALGAAPARDAAVPAVEPSGLSVSHDVAAEPPSVVTTTPVVTDASMPAAERKKRTTGWSPLNIAVVCAGLTLSAGLVLSTTMYQSPSARAAAESKAAEEKTKKAAASRSALSDVDVALPDLAAGLGSTSLGRGTSEPAKDAVKEPVKDGPKFGRLTIRGAARSKNVYLDGKRLLGTGTRSFTVLCGTHAVSTLGRNDGKDVEIPCNGELVVDR